jgi:HD-GYP domain-containing protein (c-di-GMP phosphodiesterase class II)
MWETLKAVWYVISPSQAPDTGHAERIAGLTRELGSAMGLSDADIEGLEYAVLLHDIGQIKVRETILKKPGRLSPEEYQEIQGHPIESERIVRMMPGLENAAQWTRWHHEWWDGSGYPDRLAGRKIPLPARILVVVDAWDAMQSERPYRAAKSREQAIQELRLMAGIQFDPGVVNALHKIVSEDASL